jgi:hypothetical protein
MFVALGVILLVLDDLEEDENEPDDAEKVAADELQTVLVDAITRYMELKRGRPIDDNDEVPVPKKKKRGSQRATSSPGTPPLVNKNACNFGVKTEKMPRSGLRNER